MTIHFHRGTRRRGRGFLAAAVLVLVLLTAGLLAVTLFRIRSVEVTGNSYYSAEEIESLVISDSYSTNSLYLYLKYKYLNPEEIPFVDKVEVTLLSPGKVRLRVYEKSLVGYVSYMGANFYFDKDGVVVECSSEVNEEVPRICGLEFRSLALNKQLEVEDASIFDDILSITQLLQKYELQADRIEFGSDQELTLYFDSVRVALGKSENLENKMSRLHDIFPDLEGRSGVLRMENYTNDSKYISFEKDTE